MVQDEAKVIFQIDQPLAEKTGVGLFKIALDDFDFSDFYVEINRFLILLFYICSQLKYLIDFSCTKNKRLLPKDFFMSILKKYISPVFNFIALLFLFFGFMFGRQFLICFLTLFADCFKINYK